MFESFADLVVYQWLGLIPQKQFTVALHFFVYDTPKILTLLTVAIFVIAMIRSCFPPEKTKEFLSKQRTFVGNILAALVGMITPFCSCSAVPLFIGFMEAGVPLGITFSFLVSSPMINEVALIMLFGLFGWKVAFIYMMSGFTIAVVSGYVIGKLRLEHLVEEYVYQTKNSNTEVVDLTFQERCGAAKQFTIELLKNIWLYIVVAIGIGAVIHGYVPEDFLVKYAGRGNSLAVPLAVLIGVPLYNSAAGMVPITYALMEKGVPLGTALAFMMAVSALSMPEMIILRRVLKAQLIAVFVGILSVAIIITGYLFNLVIE